MLPPNNRFWLEYYFNPLAGPKTLYGAIVAIPVAAFLVSVPWRDLSYREAMDRWTPALLSVLGVARLACFAQGCCYGKRSDLLGVAMPPPSVLYYRHLRDGLIAEGSWSLPAVPTQAISSIAIFAICYWTLRQLRSGHSGVFPPAIAVYSMFRFTIEFFRDDPARNFYGMLTTSQWIALFILILYAGYRAWCSARNSSSGSDTMPSGSVV